MISQACNFINSNINKFFVVCEDRVVVYDSEPNSLNDDGARAIESFRYEPYQLTAEGFVELCIDCGADYEVA
jgi:hypothetical protein